MSVIDTPTNKPDGPLTFGTTLNSNFFGGSKGKGGSRIKVAVRIRPLMDSE